MYRYNHPPPRVMRALMGRGFVKLEFLVRKGASLFAIQIVNTVGQACVYDVGVKTFNAKRAQEMSFCRGRASSDQRTVF